MSTGKKTWVTRDQGRAPVDLAAAYREHVDAPPLDGPTYNLTVSPDHRLQLKLVQEIDGAGKEMVIGTLIQPATTSSPADSPAAAQDAAEGASTMSIHYWDGDGLMRDPGMREYCQELLAQVFGRDLSEADLARLTAAPDGATLDIIPYRIGGVLLDMNCQTHRTRFVVSRQQDNTIQVNNILVRNRDRRTPSTARDIVDTLFRWREFGITSVHASAVRGENFNGFSAWARLGFVGDIPQTRQVSRPGSTTEFDQVPVLALIQARYGPDITRVEQLMRQRGGAALWKQVGGTWSASFDLRDGSPSMEILKHFRR